MHSSLVSHNIAEKINFVTKCNCVASPIVCVGASLGCELQPRYVGSKRLTTGAVRLFIGVKLQGSTLRGGEGPARSGMELGKAWLRLPGAKTSKEDLS
jgi:hypothetical protein